MPQNNAWMFFDARRLDGGRDEVLVAGIWPPLLHGCWSEGGPGHRNQNALTFCRIGLLDESGHRRVRPVHHVRPVPAGDARQHKPLAAKCKWKIE